MDTAAQFPLMPEMESFIRVNEVCKKQWGRNPFEVMWILAFRELYLFSSKKIHACELQFQILWTRLLNIVLAGDRKFQDIDIGVQAEFPLKEVLPDFPTSVYVDHAAFLNGSLYGGHPAMAVPFLLCETSAREVLRNEDHKDYRKLTDCMASCLHALMGVVTDKDDIERLRIFGVFFGGTQYHFCVMRVEYDESTKGVTFLFHMETQWQFSLRGSEPTDTNFNDEIVLDHKEIPFSAAEQVIENIYEEKRRMIAEEVRDRNICQSLSDQRDEDIIENLIPFVRFCIRVRQYSNTLYDILKEKPDNRKLARYPLQQFGKPEVSRSSHHSDTPAKKKTKRNTKTSHKTKGKYVEKIKPKSSVLEGELLSLCQGPGIVGLVEYHGLQAQDSGVLLVEEKLTRVDFEGLSVNELAIQAVKVIVNGARALNTLRANRVVHCDVSPNNLMFCEETQEWKLTDFDAAIRIRDGSESVIRDRIFGTNGYIAPESLDRKEYSFLSDWWSFGKTAEYLLEQIDLAYMSSQEECGHEFSNFLPRLQLLAFLMCSKTPDQRPLSQKTLTELEEKLNSLYTKPMS